MDNGPLLVILSVFGTFGLILMLGGVHVIKEGHVGIYSRGGALIPGVSEPGLNFMFPLATKLYDVQITLQTDKVMNIPCGTSGGVMIYFEKIEVVNRLRKEFAFETIKNYTIEYDKTWIFSKIEHEINQFCSSHSLQEVYITKFDTLDESLQKALQKGCSQWAPGIEIIAVRVTKPRIPENILKNYEKMESEKTNLLIAKERQKVIEKETETQKIVERIYAETEAEVSKIKMEEDVLIKEANKKLEDIDNQRNLEKQKGIAEANYYRNIKEIDINKRRLSANYMKYETAMKIKSLSKTYYGKSIPQYFMENSGIFNVAQKEKFYKD